MSKERKLIPVELNLAEYPFFIPGDRKVLKKVIEIGAGKFVEMSSSEGLPGPFDADVFLALCCIAKELNFPKRVYFSLSELAKFFGVDRYSYHKQFKESLRRLWATLFLFRGTFYRDGKYTGSFEHGSSLKLVNEYHIYDVKDPEDAKTPKRKAKEITYFELHPYILENVFKKYFRYVDFEQFKTLDGLAKRLYLYYTKHLGDQKEYKISFNLLCHRIPLETYTIHHYKKLAIKILLKAHEELKKQGLFDYAYDSEREIFTIRHIKKLEATKTKSMHNSAAELVKYFRITYLHESEVKPTKRELENATRLLEEVGWDKAKYVVDFACRQGQETNYQMKYFGAVLAYKEEALKQLELEKERATKRVKKEQEELQRITQLEKTKSVVIKYKNATASEVKIAGTFNNWEPENMGRIKDEWSTILELEPGEYQYKFVVDGNWICDPNCAEKVKDPVGNENSVLRVEEKVECVKKIQKKILLTD